MKCKIIFFLLSIGFISTLHAQIIDNNLKAPTVVTHRIPIQISKIDLVSDSSKPDGNGHKIYFHAIITSTGTGTVDYQWIVRGTNGQPNMPPPVSLINGTLTLSGTGTDHAYHTSSYGSHGLITIQLKTTTPVVAFSPTRTY